MPTEWEYHPAILLAWPHKDTDWNGCLKEVREFYKELIGIFVEKDIKVLLATPNPDSTKKILGESGFGKKIIYLNYKTNDTWTRDFGPITVFEHGTPVVCDFKFNGWGLKFPSDRDNLLTSSFFLDPINGEYENHLSFVLEGGSIESDGNGTIMTTTSCLLSPNRNGGMTKEEIETKLMDSLGAVNVLWLEHGGLTGDDTDGHIDTLARFCPNRSIVFIGCDDESDEHYKDLQMMKKELSDFKDAEGKPYSLFELPLPDAIYDDNGNRLPATYANFLATPEFIVMPTYGQKEKDEIAKQVLCRVFQKEVIGIDSRILITQHGSLHCATMQLPDSII